MVENTTHKCDCRAQLGARNALGTGPFHEVENAAKTLTFDPVFIPQISIKGKPTQPKAHSSS